MIDYCTQIGWEKLGDTEVPKLGPDVLAKSMDDARLCVKLGYDKIHFSGGRVTALHHSESWRELLDEHRPIINLVWPN